MAGGNPVFKTTNGGASWTRVHSGMSGATVLSLAVSASSQVYAGIDTIVSGGMPDTEAFVSKLNPEGDSLVYSTYLGGFGNDDGDAVAVDSSGDAYVVGQTASADFPVAGPRTSSLQGASDAFVTKLNPTGTSLLFSTLVGGAQSEIGRSVILDAAGNVISGDAFDGINIGNGGEGSNNLIQGNIIGLNASATTPLGNGGSGVIFNLGAKNRVLLHIFDSNTPLLITVDNFDGISVPVAEGDTGTKNGVVTVRLSAATSRTVTVDYNILSI